MKKLTTLVNHRRKRPALWEDRELERRRSEAIDKTLEELESLPTHELLMRFMKSQGFPVTLLNVSGELQEGGAARSEEHDRISSSAESEAESRLRRFQGLIATVTTLGTYGIFINVRKHAGLALVAALDGTGWEELAGTVADDSGVTLFTANKSCQDRGVNMARIRAS